MIVNRAKPGLPGPGRWSMASQRREIAAASCTPEIAAAAIVVLAILVSLNDSKLRWCRRINGDKVKINKMVVIFDCAPNWWK